MAPALHELGTTAAGVMATKHDAKSAARRKLVRGPTSETITVWLRGLRRRLTDTGTGLAQP